MAALLRACEAIAGHPGTGYRFTRERVATDDGWGQQLLVWTAPPARAGRRAPRALARAAAGLRLPRRPERELPDRDACMHALHAGGRQEDIRAWTANMTA